MIPPVVVTFNAEDIGANDVTISTAAAMEVIVKKLLVVTLSFIGTPFSLIVDSE